MAFILQFYKMRLSTLLIKEVNTMQGQSLSRLQVASSAFKEGETIPSDYTVDVKKNSLLKCSSSSIRF